MLQKDDNMQKMAAANIKYRRTKKSSALKDSIQQLMWSEGIFFGHNISRMDIGQFIHSGYFYSASSEALPTQHGNCTRVSCRSATGPYVAVRAGLEPTTTLRRKASTPPYATTSHNTYTWLNKSYSEWLSRGLYVDYKARIPQPPRRNLGQVFHSQLSVALRRETPI